MTKKIKADTWMPFYVGDYLADTMYLTTEQHGAYLLLMLACWKGGGSIPNDEESLMAIAKLLPSSWHSSRIKLLAFFDDAGDGTLTHKRIIEERAKALETSAARSSAGKKGAKAHWQKNSKDIANAIAEPIANSQQNDTPSPSPSQLKTKSVSARADSQNDSHASAGQLSKTLRGFSIASNPSDPRLIAIAEQGVSIETMRAACEAAREAKGASERIAPGYVFAILANWAKQASEGNAAGAQAPNQQRGNVHAERKRTLDGLTGRSDVANEHDDGRTIDGEIRVVGGD